MVLRLVSYLPRCASGTVEPRLGALLDGAVVDVAELCDAQAEDCGCTGSVAALLACPECQAAARHVLADSAESAPRLPLEQVRLLAPVRNPGKLFCLAGNYAAHIQEERGAEVHKSDMATPRIFLKPATNTVCGPDAPVLIGRQAQFVDYEGELAVIIGKRGKYIPADEALGHVGGVTCLNDISERRLHIWDRPEERPWDRFFDWLNGKWWDSFAPMGPCAVPLADIGDIQNLQLTTRLNGEVVQSASTADMIFSVARTIEYLSQMVTLAPGDIIATGTPSGVGNASGIAMKPGDVVEVEIEGIGTLRNPVVAEGSP
jgi:2-keto-4-pentenoate hydratase/2-oxohepta-3-ene-1,7-dioic acid hydratase in catechol pathway